MEEIITDEELTLNRIPYRHYVSEDQDNEQDMTAETMKTQAMEERMMEYDSTAGDLEGLTTECAIITSL
jgi:hypothetical protein